MKKFKKVNKLSFLVSVSQLSLLVCIFICTALAPRVIFGLPQGGLSNFGTLPKTIWIFSIGFWSSIVFLINARHYTKNKILRTILSVYATLLLVLILSTYPYKLNDLYKNLHIFIGLIVAIFQFASIYWLFKITGLEAIVKFAIAMMLLGFGFGIVTILNLHGLLFTSQLFGGVGYAILLIRASHLAITGHDHSS